MSRLPLRLRVAAGFTAAAALVMLALGAFVYLRVQATLEDQTRASLIARADAIARLPAGGRVAAVAELTGDTFAQILAPGGRVVASSPTVREPLLRAPRPQSSVTTFVEARALLASEDERETALVVARRADGQVVAVGTSREHVEDALDGVLTQLLIGLPLALLLAAAVGHLAAGAALRPIDAIRRRAAAITADSATERLPVPQAHDELHRLATTLNTMLDRLDAGLRRERRFVAEAGHELRTPLALLTTELTLALARPRSHDELIAAIQSASEEVGRLTALSEDLLAIANPETDNPGGEASEISLAPLLDRIATRFEHRATDLGRALRVRADADLSVRGDAARLDRAISNLVDNALRHGIGDVQLSACARDDLILVSVADHGNGTPGHGTAVGAGLGLAIVNAIARQHNGVVTTDSHPDQGTTVTVTLPASPPAPEGESNTAGDRSADGSAPTAMK